MSQMEQNSISGKYPFNTTRGVLNFRKRVMASTSRMDDKYKLSELTISMSRLGMIFPTGRLSWDKVCIV